MSQHKKFTLDELLDSVEHWLVTGELNLDILAPDFHFSSPFWKQANREEFLAQFNDAVMSQKYRAEGYYTYMALTEKAKKYIK